MIIASCVTQQQVDQTSLKIYYFRPIFSISDITDCISFHSDNSQSKNVRGEEHLGRWRSVFGKLIIDTCDVMTILLCDISRMHINNTLCTPYDQ